MHGTLDSDFLVCCRRNSIAILQTVFRQKTIHQLSKQMPGMFSARNALTDVSGPRPFEARATLLAWNSHLVRIIPATLHSQRILREYFSYTCNADAICSSPTVCKIFFSGQPSVLLVPLQKCTKRNNGQIAVTGQTTTPWLREGAQPQKNCTIIRPGMQETDTSTTTTRHARNRHEHS